MYIAPGQGQTTPWRQNFYVNRNSLSLCPFVASFKKRFFEVWFFTIFMLLFFCFFFHMYIAPGRGRQPIGDKHFMTTERRFLFAHMLQVSKWSLRNQILYTFLMILYMYIHVHSPGARAENPLGTIFWCQQKTLSTLTICCKFQINLFEFSFYTHFLMCFFSTCI